MGRSPLPETSREPSPTARSPRPRPAAPTALHGRPPGLSGRPEHGGGCRPGSGGYLNPFNGSRSQIKIIIFLLKLLKFTLWGSELGRVCLDRTVILQRPPLSSLRLCSGGSGLEREVRHPGSGELFLDSPPCARKTSPNPSEAPGSGLEPGLAHLGSQGLYFDADPRPTPRPPSFRTPLGAPLSLETRLGSGALPPPELTIFIKTLPSVSQPNLNARKTRSRLGHRPTGLRKPESGHLSLSEKLLRVRVGRIRRQSGRGEAAAVAGPRVGCGGVGARSELNRLHRFPDPPRALQVPRPRPSCWKRRPVGLELWAARPERLQPRTQGKALRRAGQASAPDTSAPWGPPAAPERPPACAGPGPGAEGGWGRGGRPLAARGS